MNKIIYTLGFLLIFSLFNSAKAQTADVDPCTKVNGAVDITTQKIQQLTKHVILLEQQI